MTVVLPYPPAANNLYFTTKTGARVLSSRGREFKLQAGWIAKAAGMRPSKGPLTVTLRVYRPRKRGDLDNMLKVVFDALKNIAWDDDEQVTVIHAYRWEDPRNPRVELTVEKVNA